MPEPTLTVRLPSKLRAHLGKHAKGAHKSQSAVVIEALNEYLERRQRDRHHEKVKQELKRLAKIERDSPDLQEFYGAPDEDPWAGGS